MEQHVYNSHPTQRSRSVGAAYGFTTHSTPLECESLDVVFSIDIARLWSAETPIIIVKSTITWTSRMGEVTNLASGGVGLVPPEMSTYFRALL